MNTGIYQIKNTINNNCYIGQSSNLKNRKFTHLAMLKNNYHPNKHLQRAYNKYGKNKFVFRVLLYCEEFELTKYEQMFVDIINPQYNILRECVNSRKGIKHTKEALHKMCLAQKERRKKTAEKRKQENYENPNEILDIPVFDDFIKAWKKERAKMTAEMLKLRNQGKTYQEIGDQYGITKQRAYQIIKKAVKDA